MKTRKITKRIVSMLAAAIISVSCFAITSFAAYSDGDIIKYGGKETTSTTAGSGEQIIRADSGKYYLISDANYAKLQKAYEKTGPGSGGTEGSDGKALSDVGGEQVDKVKEATGDFNLKPDTETASTALEGFKPILSTFLGVVVVLITIGMTIFSAFDIAYIAFPVFRNKCEEAKQTGSGMMASKKQGKNGETKLRFVSDEAQYAVEAADTIESGKNPFSIYFGKRVISYVLLSIILFILLTGNINLITNIAVRIVSGILELLQGIGT